MSRLALVPNSPRRRPTMSVVVPTHGRTDLFLETLASLERQTLDSIEVIVTDDSPELDDRRVIRDAVKSYGDRTGRTASYLFSRARLGQAANTNQGLKATTGRFVRILHSDDLLAPRTLESEAALLDNEHLQLSLLYHLVEPFTAQPRFDRQPSLSLVQPTLFFRSVLHSGTPLPSATVFRRELLEEVGGMREDFDFLCDWELFTRLLIAERRHNGFLGQLTPGFVGWRTHMASTTGRLWHRHFLEHEQFMGELRADRALTEGLIGDTGTVDGFFATAVRYRYRRLQQDAARMTWSELLRQLPRLLRCALSRCSLRERLRPAPWTARGARAYPDLVVKEQAAQRTAPKPWWPTLTVRRSQQFVDPRAGWRFALSAHLSAAIIGWGKRVAADYAAATSRGLETTPGPAPLTLGARIDVSPTMAASPEVGSVSIMSEFNNGINLWPLRRLIGNADAVTVHHLNGNTFVEPVLHQVAKYVGVGKQLSVPLADNAHLTSFGFKALLERMFAGQFKWSGQTTAAAGRHHLHFKRRIATHPTYSEEHTGWTFGMLTSGTRLANVEAFINSIERSCQDPYEVLIVSPVPLPSIKGRRNVTVLRFNERDDLGWITRKKNVICQRARYSDILICHDRFTLTADFCRAFSAWGYAYGLAAPRVQLADGRRGLDWAVVSSQNKVWSLGGLLDYRAYSQYAYNPGGATLIRKAFWRDFGWNDNLFWNEHEDVELCRRIQHAGGLIALSGATLVAAEDRWIDHNPRIPYCEQNEVLFGRPVGEQRIRFLPAA